MAVERESDRKALSQPPATFFSLPRELRDQVYDLVINGITAAPFGDSGFSSVQPRPAHKLCIKGGHISRQFRAEFLPRLHGAMTFMIFDYRNTPRATRDQNFIEIFGPSRIPLSRVIQFCGGEFRGCKIALPTDQSSRIVVRGHIMPLEEALRMRITALAQDVAVEDEGLLCLTVEGIKKLGACLETLRV